jgi:hypothetical protein
MKDAPQDISGCHEMKLRDLMLKLKKICEISSSHGGEYDVQS